MSNPLLSPFDEAPFSQIKTEHFLPAIQQGIENSRNEIEAITSNPEAPTFENTVEALEYSGWQLDRITSIFFNLNSAETNETIQKTAQEVSPLLSEFSNDITLNAALFERIKSVHDRQEEFQLDPEQTMLLHKRYTSFVRNGALLSESDKDKLREIDKELSQRKLTFGENVLAETNAFELHIVEENDLDGLPETAKQAAKEAAKAKQKDGWIITLNYPSYVPFMTYAKNRALRKKLALAFGSKGFHENGNNNEEQVKAIATLRYQRAKLLGYDSHAHFVLEQRMAETPQQVRKFLDTLLEKAKPAAQREYLELQQFAKKQDGIETLQKWDGSFYAERLKQQRYQLDDEKLKPYFELMASVKGMFEVANRLFGLKFLENTDVDVYHNEVTAYDVYDADGRFMALFYTDFHPRPGKRNGAWMTSYKPQKRQNGKEERPHISIVCNFTPATEHTPSLLTFNEVTTLFHEFGHALHGILADTTYPSLSGTGVYWDFVELPSQIMENWCYEEEALSLFAKHYQTGASIPMELVQRIKEASTFNEGMATLRQLSFGYLDMSWHAGNPTGIDNVKRHEQQAFSGTSLYPETTETCMSTAFSHIFQGGYSAGYYSYKWAEVLDADAFAYFKEKGIFNSEVATSFRNTILSQGGTQPPMFLYKKFRGAEPNPEALLKRAGLLEEVS